MFLDTQQSSGGGGGLIAKQKQASEPVAMNVLLGSSTSLIYSWHVSVADLLGLNAADEKSGGRERGQHQQQQKKKEAPVCPPSHLVGVIELPLKVKRAKLLNVYLCEGIEE